MKKSFRIGGVLLNVALAAALSSSLVAHAATSTLDQIKQSKQFRIGVAPGDPWYFKDPLTGQWSGVGVGVGERIAKDLGAKLVPVETTWGNSVAALQANQIDAMFVLDATEERKKAADFPTNPLLWYKLAALERPGLNAKTWDDLNKPDVKVGTTLGSSPDLAVTKALTKAHIERFANTDETVAAFMAGRVDAIVFYHPVLVIAYSHIHKGTLVVPTPVNALPTSAGIRKDDPALRGQFKKTLEGLLTSPATC
ncbi:transporter substrate-binding domain-containing protein [Burkholderia sp. Ac-20344]|uniref:transporter substrate-binding domain-containing protein n=1 Tax=Burkholderia sp. Ac-20344 TaxID=2703890 RepID=UPI00197C5542|nr:transporter substrate-binding domain-containing protein [Burkholderia sp. Ac-20344]